MGVASRDAVDCRRSRRRRYRESHATGPKGIAKTKLAIEVACDLLPEFCSQGLLMELARLSDAALVSSAVASVMGQNAEVNAIFDEALGILGHAELWSQICCIRGHERPHRALTELFSHSGSEQPT
jgi:hypothetical protein